MWPEPESVRVANCTALSNSSLDAIRLRVYLYATGPIAGDLRLNHLNCPTIG